MQSSVSGGPQAMRSLFIISILLIVTGCAAPDISSYKDREPKFSLFDYFEGNTRGWGIVQNRQGEVTRQFTVDILGTIEAGVLTMNEKFIWNDGEKSTRIWEIRKSEHGGYEGTAEDVVGTAAGMSAGNVLKWQYVLGVRSGDSTWNISFDDWMFLQPDEVLINKTRMSKFGFHVGDVTIVFRKNSP